jgi:hypothetical protein
MNFFRFVKVLVLLGAKICNDIQTNYANKKNYPSNYNESRNAASENKHTHSRSINKRTSRIRTSSSSHINNTSSNTTHSMRIEISRVTQYGLF